MLSATLCLYHSTLNYSFLLVGVTRGFEHPAHSRVPQNLTHGKRLLWKKLHVVDHFNNPSSYLSYASGIKGPFYDLFLMISMIRISVESMIAVFDIEWYINLLNSIMIDPWNKRFTIHHEWLIFVSSDSYSRTCDTSNECKENYDCTTEITDYKLLVEKAIGVPAKVLISSSAFYSFIDEIFHSFKFLDIWLRTCIL